MTQPDGFRRIRNVILDTCFLIDVQDGDGDALRVSTDLETGPHRLRVSAVSLAELQTGVMRVSDSLNSLDEMVKVTATKDVIPISRSIALRAGRLHGELQNRGEEVDMLDCFIAATALDYEEPVVTRNLSHFERIDGVFVHSY